MTWLWLIAAAAFALQLPACASLPPLPPRTESTALQAWSATPLAQRVAARQPQTATQRDSGVRAIIGGTDALATLIAMAQQAQRTLDLQYYAILNETSTRVLLQHVRDAADRGVRVRVLVDDLATTGTDAAMLRLARHPRIDVRFYNPQPIGRFSAVTKVLTGLHDFDRINRRMHNKLFIADNALAMTGGRNLGDPYFLQTGPANFVDLDLLVAGPAVRSMSAMFDRFWNSELSYPVEALVEASGVETEPPAAASAASAASPRDARMPPAAGKVEARQDAPGEKPPLDAADVLPEPYRSEVEQRLREWERRPPALSWAPVRLLADAPTKALRDGEPAPDETMFDDLGHLLAGARSSVLLVSPYFVPGERGMAAIAALRRRGITVRVLTASLASTDAPIVHVGYRSYRERLLALGVELFELRADTRVAGSGGVDTGGSALGSAGISSSSASRTNLHAKAIIIDQRLAIVGTMNLDPRSALLNTEMGLVTFSRDVGSSLQRLFDDVCVNGAYAVVPGDDGLRWRSRNADGSWSETGSEPGASSLTRFFLMLLAPLAPESML